MEKSHEQVGQLLSPKQGRRGGKLPPSTPRLEKSFAVWKNLPPPSVAISRSAGLCQQEQSKQSFFEVRVPLSSVCSASGTDEGFGK